MFVFMFMFMFMFMFVFVFMFMFMFMFMLSHVIPYAKHPLEIPPPFLASHFLAFARSERIY